MTAYASSWQMKASIGSPKDDNCIIRATVLYCSAKDIPLSLHPSYHWEFDTLSFDELSESWSALDHSIAVDNFASQDRDARPVEELDTFVRRVVARIVQIARMVQPPGHKVFVTMPDYQICIRADLNCALLWIHAVQLRRILRCQFDETFDIQTLAS